MSSWPDDGGDASQASARHPIFCRQVVYDHSRLTKHLSQDFANNWPIKLGIMSTISPDEIRSSR